MERDVASRLLSAFAEALPAERLSTAPAVLQARGRDYHWFSQILEEELRGLLPDLVCTPETADELTAALAVSYELRVPTTFRGGGTGNYGQCVPLRGGVVVDVSRLRRVLDLDNGSARVETGITFAALDRAAASTNQEITIYPSTYYTATVGGFVAGGSMGVGSIEHGTIADGYVLGATVLPCVERPEQEAVEGDALGAFTHTYGTAGAIVDVTVPLVPRRRWEQAVVGFDDVVACHAFCLDLMADDAVAKRMITLLEPPIVRLYVERTHLPFVPELTAAMVVVGDGTLGRVTHHAEQHGGRVEFTLGVEDRERLADYSWNHSTLWAKKADPSLTYLQAEWSLDDFEHQREAVRREWDGVFALHGEYVLWGGSPAMLSLPIVGYEGRARLAELVELLESTAVTIANPHTFVLEEGHGASVDRLLDAKRRNDPAGLLNPGKVAAVDGAGFLGRESTMSFTERT